MKKIVVLALLLLCVLPSLVFATAKDDFTLSVSLVIGERSRDSHAETTRISLAGNNLTYERTYSGARASSREAVRREFKLKGSEISRLKSLIKEKDLLGSGSLNFKPAAGQLTYFEMNIRITLKGIISTQELSGPRAAINIKDERVYQKAIALLQELYRLINLREQGINYQEPVS
ncbi:MAG: hypothetical protein ICV68_00025 [Pyrinomonadaceae bacterium]|nr:hypothetical protein [Pyrinomonadaceae bacterium]